jgi:hypothetical protein
MRRGIPWRDEGAGIGAEAMPDPQAFVVDGREKSAVNRDEGSL